MPAIHLETFIGAPIGRCFDLMRDVELHTLSTSKTHERAVAGKTNGLLGAGDEVTWEAVHFGVKQRLTARVTRCEAAHLLVDEMVRGAFKTFTHRRREVAPPDSGGVLPGRTTRLGPLVEHFDEPTAELGRVTAHAPGKLHHQTVDHGRGRHIRVEEGQ